MSKLIDAINQTNRLSLSQSLALIRARALCCQKSALPGERRAKITTTYASLLELSFKFVRVISARLSEYVPTYARKYANAQFFALNGFQLAYVCWKVLFPSNTHFKLFPFLFNFAIRNLRAWFCSEQLLLVNLPTHFYSWTDNKPVIYIYRCGKSSVQHIARTSYPNSKYMYNERAEDAEKKPSNFHLCVAV